MFAWFAALKRSDRLRAIGWVVLAFGLAGAAVVYWVAGANRGSRARRHDGARVHPFAATRDGRDDGPVRHRADRMAAEPHESDRASADDGDMCRAGGGVFLSGSVGARCGARRTLEPSPACSSFLLVGYFGNYNTPFIPMVALLLIGALLWVQVDPTRELFPEDRVYSDA